MTFLRQRLRALFTAATAIVLSATAKPAHASPEDDARALFARGRELRQLGDCAHAIPVFRKATTIFPEALGSLRNVAECEEDLGHSAAARRAWFTLFERARVSNSERYLEWDKDALDAASRLKPRVATIVLDVAVDTAEGDVLASEHGGVDVFLDDELIMPVFVGIPLERDPGPHRVRARASDGREVETTLMLAPGDDRSITLRLMRTGTPARARAAPEPTVAARDDGATRRTLAWAAVGTGAAALVGAGLALASRATALRELETECPTHRNCTEDQRDTLTRSQRMTLLTSVLLPIGIVGIGGGFTLLLTTPSAGPSRSARVELRPSLGGVALGGTF